MEHLSSSRLFAGLEPEEIKEIVAEAAFHDFNEGEIILSPHNERHDLYVMLRGTAKLASPSTSQGEIIVDVFTEGDVFGLRSMLSRDNSSASLMVVSTSECSVAAFSWGLIEREAECYPRLGINLSKILAERILRLDDRMESQQSRDAQLLDIVRLGEGSELPHRNISETVFFKRREGIVRNLAESGESLLVWGETGVGKRQFGRTIFKMSSTFKRLYLTVNFYRAETLNSPASKDPLTPEQVLFGWRDGSSTQVGLLEVGRGGTLFILGIERLDEHTQQRLFRHIQELRYPSAGSAGVWEPGPRIIASSLRDPVELESSGRLIPELSDHFKAHSFHILPLRERRRDIESHVEYYLEKFSRELEKDVTSVAETAKKVLIDYDWPGNDAELSETIKRGIVLARTSVLEPEEILLDYRTSETKGRRDLLRVGAILKTLKNPFFPAVVQWTATPFFLILLAFLLLGPSDSASNIGSVYSWALGWPMMVFGSFFWARFWCAICPMGSLGEAIKFIKSKNRPIPQFLRRNSSWMVAATAIGVMWLEIALRMRDYPARLGLVLLVVVIASVIFAYYYERQSWCAYLCGLGGIMGLFAKLSPFELRADRNICHARCTAHQCYTGTGERKGCPLFVLPPTLDSNQGCKFCATCVKNCQHGSLNLSLRAPGRELWDSPSQSAALSIFTFAMMGALACEMTADAWVGVGAGFAFRASALFLGWEMTALVSLLIVSMAGSLIEKSTLLEHLKKYGQAYLPLVLTGFMAFHGYYLLRLGGPLLEMVGSSLGLEPFSDFSFEVGLSTVRLFQQSLVFAGFLWTAMIHFKLARSEERQRKGKMTRAAGVATLHAIVGSGIALSLNLGLSIHFFG